MATRWRLMGRPWLGGLALLWGLAAPVSAVEIECAEVGDPGNAADITGFGDVDYVYCIGLYEITNDQYIEFLNAVADSDPTGLYNPLMGLEGTLGGITQSGSDGSYSYAARADRGSKPVNYVSIWDAIRFVNWLENGQPAGPVGDATTEDGAYTFPETDPLFEAIPRNQDATTFFPTENEWYKAAYYDTESMTYFDYPYGTDTQTQCRPPGDGAANSASCTVFDVITFRFGPYDVGSYTNSPGPNGTFDQGGNMSEWVDTPDGAAVNRGGSYGGPASNLVSTWVQHHPDRVSGESGEVSFRVVSATLPEVGTALQSLTVMLLLGALRRRAKYER